jgi:hypothetical protein
LTDGDGYTAQEKSEFWQAVLIVIEYSLLSALHHKAFVGDPATIVQQRTARESTGENANAIVVRDADREYGGDADNVSANSY